MPPAQPFVTSIIRGFVCRTCRAQLRRPQRPPVPWLVRSVANGPSKGKARKGKSKEPPIRYFDQTPDGRRTEAADDPEAAAMLKDVEEQIRLLEEDEGNVVEEDERLEDPLQALREQFEIPKSMMSTIQEMEAQMQNITNLENLSEEERASIRSRLLRFGTEGMRIISTWNVSC
jgi:hypothetical protein